MYRAVPASVNNLSAVASSPESIKVMWSRPTFPNGPITYYMVYFQEGNVQNQPITDNGFNTTKTSTPTPSINVTGLKPYTNYTIHVRAIIAAETLQNCLLYTSPSPRDATLSRMPSSA